MKKRSFIVGKMIMIPVIIVWLTIPRTAYADHNPIHTEVQKVIQLVQNAILGTIIPSKNFKIGNCAPEFGWSWTGVTLRFSRSDVCPLAGDIRLGFFPPSAQVRMDVFNLQYVESLNFDATIIFATGWGTLELGFQFLNGQIAIRPIPQLPGIDFVLNGKVSTKIGKGTFIVSARDNVFEKLSGAGFALVTIFAKEPNIARVRKIETCTLTGGVPNDVGAGTLSNCMALGL